MATADTILDDWPDPYDRPGAGGGTLKIYVDGVPATIVAERVEYLDENGKSRHRVPARLHEEGAAEALRQPRRLPEALERRRTQAGHSRRAGCNGGLPLELVAAELNRDLDPFDLICHVAFDAKPLTRRERADNVKKARTCSPRYGDQARAVLDALLAKYADEGVLQPR